jgi:hypothetical protein
VVQCGPTKLRHRHGLLVDKHFQPARTLAEKQDFDAM